MPDLEKIFTEQAIFTGRMTGFLQRKEKAAYQSTFMGWELPEGIHAITKTVFAILFAVTIQCLCKPQTFAQKIHFDRLSIAEGLSSNSVYTIFQDSHGNLWFGTLDGLNRYDGYAISSYEHDAQKKSSISNNRVTFIFEDQFHRLWFYDEFTGTLTRYNRMYEEFSSYNLNILADNDMATVIAGFEPEPGRICLQSIKGVTVCYDADSDSFNREHAPPFVKPAIIDDPKWANVLNAFKQHLARSDNPFSIEKIFIKEIIRDAEGRYWIATKYDGLYTATEQQGVFEFISHLHTTDRFQKMDSEEINDLYEDSSNVIWIGTRNHGLYQYTPFRYKFNLIDEITIGKERHPIGAVRAIVQDNNDDLWVGTNEQGLLRVTPQLGTGIQYLPRLGDKSSIGSRFIRSLWLDDDSGLWIGHYDGFSRYRKTFDNFQQYIPAIESDEEVRVYDFKKGRESQLWIAAWDVILNYNISHNQYDFITRSMPDPSGFSNENIRELQLDDAGDLWIAAGEKGLSVYNKSSKKFTNINYHPDSASGLPSNNIFDIHKDSHGNLWLATADGLCRFDPASITFNTFTVNDGLPSNLIYGILEDHNGHLWMSTTKGISKFDPVKKTFRNYDVSDGLQSNEFTENAFYQHEDGTMYFGGIKGLNYFNPDLIPDNPNPPKLAITNIRVYDQPLTEVAIFKAFDIQQRLSSHGEIVLSAEQRSISLEFVAYHFVQPLKNKYAFMLEGFDNDWTYRDANARFANYTNLESGTYYFLLKASNSDGVWTTEPLRLKIVIEPPFYTTAWFIISSLLGLVSVGVWGYKKRISVLKKQQSMKSAQLESELNFLKSQVNPHFLFNTLNNIYALCQVNSINAAPMVGKVSEMMRYMIYDCNAHLVPLEREIEYLQNYIDLNQLKTNKRLNVSFEVQGQMNGQKIAPLLLINFLENSFKHGDLNSNRDGFIDARLVVNDQEMKFLLMNSFKNNITTQVDRHGIGIENVKHRLSLLYPEKYALRIEKKMSTFEVELKLQLD